MAWYSTGSITATNNSGAITGVGTLFMANVRVGDGVTIAGSTSIHQVVNVTSDTQLSVSPVYTGTTGSGKTFGIIPVQGYVKDLADQARAIILQTGAVTPTTGPTDATAGRVTRVGDFGLAGPAIAIPESALNDKTRPTMFMFVTAGALSVLPSNTNHYVTHVFNPTANYALQTAYTVAGDKSFIRGLVNGTWSPWVAPNTDVVDNLTSTDVTKALSAKQGKVLKDLIDASAGGSASITQYKFNLSAGQTTVSGADISGQTLTYTVGVPMFVELAGFPLWLGNDYAASTGNSLALLTAAESASELQITVLGNFTVANTYTKAEVDGKIGTSAMPVGMMFSWSLSEASIPGGTLPRNGQLVDRATWPDLWAKVSSQTVTDAVWLAAPYDQRGKYSSGDGSTTFRMPDTNGKHPDGNTIAGMTLRGYGKNSAGTPGVHQADQFQGFQYGDPDQPAFQYMVAVNQRAGGTAVPTYSSLGMTSDTADTTAAGNYCRVSPVTNGTNGTPRYGNETRSSNETVIWLTVGATSKQNTGAVDVTALAISVNSVSTRTTALEGIVGAGFQMEVETLWTGSVGNVVTVTLSRNLRAGDMIFLRHNDGNQLITNTVPIIEIGANRYMLANSGNALTGMIIPAANQITFNSYTSGYGVSNIYAMRIVKK